MVGPEMACLAAVDAASMWEEWFDQCSEIRDTEDFAEASTYQKLIAVSMRNSGCWGDALAAYLQLMYSVSG